ncbi:CcmD family protein [candidate division KSB1 bacterium]|nr:CcmD family protein [candidate division KSB1 bacterium]
MDSGLNYLLAANLVIWVGLALYLLRIDLQLKKLEKSFKNKGKMK